MNVGRKKVKQNWLSEKSFLPWHLGVRQPIFVEVKGVGRPPISGYGNVFQPTFVVPQILSWKSWSPIPTSFDASEFKKVFQPLEITGFRLGNTCVRQCTLRW